MAVGDDRYEIVAIKGGLQPTAQSALLSENRIEPRNQYRGLDRGGDGTVPRPSSHPPEWPDETGAIFAAQKHAFLQNTDSVLHQLYGVLTGRLGGWMGGAQVGVQTPDLAPAGEPLEVKITAEREDEPLALHVSAEREDGTSAGTPQLAKNLGGGRYSASLESLGPGAYRVHVRSAAPGNMVDPVTDLVLVNLVWDSSVPE